MVRRTDAFKINTFKILIRIAGWKESLSFCPSSNSNQNLDSTNQICALLLFGDDINIDSKSMKLIADCTPKMRLSWICDWRWIIDLPIVPTNRRLLARREANSLRYILTVKEDQNSHSVRFLNELCLHHEIFCDRKRLFANDKLFSVYSSRNKKKGWRLFVSYV